MPQCLFCGLSEDVPKLSALHLADGDEPTIIGSQMIMVMIDGDDNGL